MGTIDKLYQDSKSFKEFTKGYFRRLNEVLEGLDITEIQKFADVLDEARKSDRTIFIAGNGGSAATASHMANDFGVDVRKYSGTKRPFRVISITDCVPVMLAIANDESYDHIFVNQLSVLFKKGDVFIAISASGNSLNVVRAAEWVKSQGGTVLALTGFDGGRLKELADVAVHVATPKGDYGHVEDVHMVIDHLLANWFSRSLREKA